MSRNDDFLDAVSAAYAVPRHLLHMDPPGTVIVPNTALKTWPDVQCEPIVVPHTIVYHGERASGRSTALQMLWRDACSDVPVNEHERRWRNAYSERAHLRTMLLYPHHWEAHIRSALAQDLGPWPPAHDSDIRLYTMSAERYVETRQWQEPSIRNVLIDGWLTLEARTRDTIRHAYLDSTSASIRAITL